MKKNFLLFTLFCLLGLPSEAQQPSDSLSSVNSEWAADSLSTDILLLSSDAPFSVKVQERLTALLNNPIFERTQVGLCVYDLTADSLLFAHGHRQLLRPASTQKLITAIAALSILGTDYRYTTRLYSQGVLLDSSTIWQGDIIVKGGFDPLFQWDDVRSFVQSLREKGIRQIVGNVVFDLSMKDTTRRGWGWCWDDPYGSLTPLLYDAKDRFKESFQEQLNEMGILLTGTFVNGITPPTAELINERHHTLTQVLHPMMKESDNLFAESVFYQLAAIPGRPWANRQAAVQQINSFFRTLGLNPQHYQVADGSGLSLYNYTTAEALVALLRYAYTHEDVYDALLPSLPIAGVDGTLRRRMRSGAAHRKVAAKTGTVEGVSSLAGFLTAGNGHRIAFAIINQGLRATATGRTFQNRICQALTTP